jgi:AcrR family transcriptional regulator
MTTPRVTPRTRAPRRDAAANRDAILAAAALALHDDIDAPLEAIAERAGLSRRSVYGHFDGRDELVGEVLTRGAERLATSVGAIDAADSRVAIALYADAVWRQIEHTRVLAQLAVRGPFRFRVAEGLAPIRRVLDGIVTRGIEAGELRRDIPAPELARLLEGTALAVLDQSVRDELSGEAARHLVIAAALSVCGLSWREAEALIAETPALTAGAVRA